MPVYNLQTEEDVQKLVTIKHSILQQGVAIFCIPSEPEHLCHTLDSDNVVLVVYDPQFRAALKTVMSRVFSRHGAEQYGMAYDTSVDEFMYIKLGSCICGYSSVT